MAYTHRITQTWRAQSDTPLTKTTTVIGEAEANLTLPFISSVNQPSALSVSRTGLKLIWLVANKLCTVQFLNTLGVVVVEKDLEVDNPFKWTHQDQAAAGGNPFTADTVKLNIEAGESGSLEVRICQDPDFGASVALTGTFLTTPTEAEVVTGGQTVIMTLAGAIWAPAGLAFDGIRQAIINGLVAAASPANGWNNDVIAAMVVTNVVRTSDTVVTITLPAVGTYSIASNEVVTATVPAGATGALGPIVATPTITIVAA